MGARKILKRETRANLVLWDERKNRKLALFDGMIVGRNSGDLIYGEDPRMSRQHLRFHLRSGEVFVEDLGSSNQTWIDRKAIAPGVEEPLRVGMVLEFGEQKFRCREKEVLRLRLVGEGQSGSAFAVLDPAENSRLIATPRASAATVQSRSVAAVKIVASVVALYAAILFMTAGLPRFLEFLQSR